MVGHFGGGREGDESIPQTAAREFREETRCAFDRPVAADLAGLTASNHDGFWTYVAEVAFQPAADIELNPCPATMERMAWIWVTLESVVQALFENNGVIEEAGQSLAIWSASADSIRKAMDDGLLDAANLCQ